MIVAVKYCDARGIVSAVFQPAKAIQDDRHRFLIADVTDNAAHDSRILAGMRAIQWTRGMSAFTRSTAMPARKPSIAWYSRLRMYRLKRNRPSAGAAFLA